MSVDAALPGDGVAPQIWRGDRLRQWLAPVLILAAAAAMRQFVVGNADVSWQITLAEKILDGQHLYTDLIEVNPPASTFLYLPAVVLAHALGAAPEIVVDALVFIGALVSVATVSHILRCCRLIEGRPQWTVAAFILAVLTILPAQTFGEREHIALIALLPMLAILAARGKAATPRLWHCLVAGAGAGVTICIKPHFVLPLALAIAATALYLRSWRVLIVAENLIGAAMGAAYAACVVVFYPAFFSDVMPLLADVYLPVRLPLTHLLVSVPVVLWAGAILVILALRRGALRDPLLPVLLAASAGFAAAYIIQGKGWPYHSYPMLALVLIALDIAGTAEQSDRRGGLKRRAVTVVLGLAAAISFVWFTIGVDVRGAAAMVKRIAPPHPSITVISHDIAVGHPLVRAVGGRWLSPFCGLWITANAALLLSAGNPDAPTRRRLLADMETERERLIDEIRARKPDVILVDNRVAFRFGNALIRWSGWVQADRDLDALIAANYQKVGDADSIAIFRRNRT